MKRIPEGYDTCLYLLRAVGNAGRCGDLGRLEQACRAMVDRNTTHLEVWFIMGMLALQQSDFEAGYDLLSEFVSQKTGKTEARLVETLLYYLENLDSGQLLLPEELQEEMIESFLQMLVSFLPHETPIPALCGMTPHEAMYSPGGRRMIMNLLIEHRVFAELALGKARLLDINKQYHLEGEAIE